VQSQTSTQSSEGITEDAHCLLFLSISRNSTSSSGTGKQFKTKQSINKQKSNRAWDDLMSASDQISEKWLSLIPENYPDIFIRDIMAQDIIVVNEDNPIEHIFELFDKYHFNTYPVIAEQTQTHLQYLYA
jgi:hypothetical protein